MQDLGTDTQVASRISTQDSHGRPSGHGDGAGGHTTSKLRGSCHACAMSKVKCPKEKPVCSRCKSRGIACQYFFTKRPGRRRESSTSRGKNNDNSRNSTTNKISNSNEHTISNSHANTNRHSASNSISNSDAENDSIVESDNRGKEARNRDTIQVVPRPPRDFTTSPASGDVIGGSVYLESPPISISTSPRPDNIPTIASADLFSTLEESDMFSGLMYPEANVEDMDFVMSDIDACFWLPSLDGTVGPAQTQKDTASLLMQMPIESSGLGLLPAASPPTNEDLRLGGSSTSSSLASNVHNPLPNADMAAATATFGNLPRCGCLEQALYLLRMLSTAPASSSSSSMSPSRTSFATPSEATSASESNTISDGAAAQAVLAENQQSIDAANKMLSCPNCAEDTFLLIVVSMIVLKTLERYAAAARPYQAQHGVPKSSDGENGDRTAAAKLANSIIYSSKEQIRVLSRTYSAQRDERSRGRMAAQLVLGELHRVQRLVNQLSPKLRKSKEGATNGHNRGFEFDLLGDARNSTSSGCGANLADGGDVSKMGMTYFSANTLDQIESDVRKSLSALSAEIIKRLRQG